MHADHPFAKPFRDGTRSKWSLAGGIAAAGAAALGATALVVQGQVRRAERKHPPTGRFIVVDGVRLHYTDTAGAGPAVVLLHGNGAMIDDMEISGLIARLAPRYRVITFDRPGYGYSDRPRTSLWTPPAQAALFRQALALLNIREPILVGHSWGTLVALAFALEFPGQARGLVLLSGYYFPTARVDVALFAPPALPVLGDVMRHTVSPLIGKALAPELIRKMFAPKPVTPQFADRYPVDLALRPSQIRASAEESALMIPAAAALEGRYRSLDLPIFIMSGSEDEIVDVTRQSVPLHDTIQSSDLQVLPGLGHMLHHFAADQIVAAVDRVEQRAASRSEPRF
jgi:pimeloyl-ACP methyl ester carboxylesterase